MCRTIITNGTIVNDGEHFIGSIIVKGEFIESVIKGKLPENIAYDTDRIIDASGKWILPGVIDDQVHFREPGLTHKAEIATESVAAVAGGITSFMEMPNTVPQTTTLEALEWKYSRAAEVSPANYSFYIGATNDNFEVLKQVDFSQVCGVKIFMGSSTGNMLVDSEKTLRRIFAEIPALIAVHCEQESIIQANKKYYTERFGEDLPIFFHPLIRSAEACYTSSAKAVELATRYDTRLHVLHLSTAREMSLFDNHKPLSEKHITGEVCVHHLWFDDNDYAQFGNRIKWNPAIKTEEDRQALLQALNDNRLDIIATDHAPHLPGEKAGVYTQSASGGPMVQHSLIVMLELMEKGQITLENIVDKMCHAPADIFHVEERGYLREGYKADIAIFEKHPWTVKKENLLYKCGWSPLEEMSFTYRVSMTLVNGQIVYDHGKINGDIRGEMLTFY